MASKRRIYDRKLCCAKCGIRLDKNLKRSKAKRTIKSKWMINYFDLLEIDIKFNPFCCGSCYKKLTKLHYSNGLIYEMAKDKTLVDTKALKFVDLVQKQERVFDNMSSDKIIQILGVSNHELNELDSIIRPEWKHDIYSKYPLGLYLARLKLGLSFTTLTKMYPCTKSSQIYRFVDSIRDILSRTFVEENLGFKRITRGLLNINHTTESSKILYEVSEESIVTIWDGTYVYIEKSSNYSFQKKTYSMHKNRPLVKLMMIVSSTGNYPCNYDFYIL